MLSLILYLLDKQSSFPLRRIFLDWKNVLHIKMLLSFAYSFEINKEKRVVLTSHKFRNINC